MPKIKKLQAYIGGFSGPSYSIELVKNNKLKYQKFPEFDELIETTTQKLNDFLKRIIEIEFNDLGKKL